MHFKYKISLIALFVTVSFASFAHEKKSTHLIATANYLYPVRGEVTLHNHSEVNRKDVISLLEDIFDKGCVAIEHANPIVKKDRIEFRKSRCTIAFDESDDNKVTIEKKRGYVSSQDVNKFVTTTDAYKLLFDLREIDRNVLVSFNGAELTLNCLQGECVRYDEGNQDGVTVEFSLPHYFAHKTAAMFTWLMDNEYAEELAKYCMACLASPYQADGSCDTEKHEFGESIQFCHWGRFMQ